MEHIVPILSISQATHNVRQFRLQKPSGYTFIPGQATEVSINKGKWIEERRPFTFTNLNEDPYLEFTIKCYTDHPGVTNELSTLKAGDELVVRDVWGAISYQGHGYFIAGGAGITPFLAILRKLHKENKLAGNRLYFSNRTKGDIILKEELERMLGDQAVFNLTEDETPEYRSGRIDEKFLRSQDIDFTKHFYICGPDPMIQDINEALLRLGANPQTVVFEK